MFKDVRINQTIYVLDRVNLSLVEGKASNVGVPYFDTRNMGNAKMVVDITIDDGSGTQTTYTVPDGVNIAYAANKILAVDRSCLSGEVQTICTESQKIVDSIDMHRERLEKCKSILSDLNPEIRERQQTEDRLNKIESSIDELKNLLITKCTQV